MALESHLGDRVILVFKDLPEKVKISLIYS